MRVADILFKKRNEIRSEASIWPDARAYIRFCERQSRLQLIKEASGQRGLSAFCAVKNELDILPAFLEHYRGLGVERFVMVDNASDDGTHEFLLRQPDVSLFFTDQPFYHSLCGRMWTDLLSSKLALGEWTLTLDADELLIYEDFERVPLPDFIASLERRQLKRLFAPLLDLYELEGNYYFDAAPEITIKIDEGLLVFGGPRQRMALSRGLQEPVLSKYPLMLFDARTSHAACHFPFPTDRNNSLCFARLLHHKLNARLRIKIDEALRDGQH